MSENVINLAAFAALKEMTGAEFINELIDAFFAETPRLMADMRQAFANNDAELFRRSAHSLNSNGNTFGALQFGALAKELEYLGRDQQLASVGNKLKTLTAEYAKVESALRGLRDG
jgi:HPt (histidine-containing phosphotransfer) domain-containing protein